jgi:hypothetical protein
VVGVAALLVLGGASAWSAFGRGPDAPRQHLVLTVPTAAAPLPIGRGRTADQDPVVVAPRPTAVRTPATTAASPRDALSGVAAKTVAVVAPPPDDPATR